MRPGQTYGYLNRAIETKSLLARLQGNCVAMNRYIHVCTIFNLPAPGTADLERVNSKSWGC